MYLNCILGHLTGVFKNDVDLVPYIIGSNEKDIKLCLLDPFHLQRTSKLSKLNQSRSPRPLIKKISADMELSIYPAP